MHGVPGVVVLSSLPTKIPQLSPIHIFDMNGFSDHDAEAVLEYWFGGARPEDNYKTKWFPTGSKDLQSKADTEITAKFAPLLARALNLNPADYPLRPSFLIAVIIVLDQFSRHIYRSLTPDNPLRKKVDALASVATDKLTSMPAWDQNLSVAEFVFTLMPYRHASTLDSLNKVMSSIDSRFQKEQENVELLTKFKKQTVRRLQHLQDRAQAEDSDDILDHHEFSVEENIMADVLKEPLVMATKQFLEDNFSGESSTADLVISLSGGVDSMVIAMILALLFPPSRSGAGTTLGRKLVAMHIDYANREESSREAAFVTDWARRHGFEVHIRVVDEVTRGITSRSDYELISRQIRYGFYKDVLLQGGWQGEVAGGGVGVIFGHHIGDIQENVISNIMRGCSPLNLAGMAAVGVTEGVPIWRPLLSHHKKEIIAFAHKYGVPYFKDTTPSWSTRGKLRNQLLPLLVDMYGVGCLNNIASLANQSDEAKKLVHCSVYKPFLESVHKYPTGLRVHVMAHRDQPISFWREMLKELMHSMSMAMVREKAVMNFVERLQRDVPRFDIWLELRKGFHTFLDINGDLFIFRDKVLQIEGGYRQSTKQGGLQEKDDALPPSREDTSSKSETCGMEILSIESNKATGTSQDISLASGDSIHMDSWQIICEVLDSSHASFHQLVAEAGDMHILPHPRELLEGGGFTYLLPLDLPISKGEDVTGNGEMRVHLRRHQSIKRPSIPVTALHGMDSKLRLGLPFLVPSPFVYSTLDSKRLPCHIVRLTYNYNPNTKN